MRKNPFVFAAVMCCAVSILALNSCDKEENVNYIKTYSYSISQTNKLVKNYYDATESSEILAALNRAIGADGNVYNTLSNPADQDMKDACDAVIKRYTNLKSIYLAFDLIRNTYDPTPGKEQQAEVIKSYELGKAMTSPYVTYSFTSNSEQAFDELANKKSALNEKVYKATERNLRRIVGYHYASGGIYFNTSSAFESRFMGVLNQAFADNTDNQNYLLHLCDSIAQAHMSDTLAVKAVVNVCKTGVVNDQTSVIKTYEFPVNVE